MKKNEMAASVQGLIKNGGFEKNMDCIFSTEFILDTNLDGKQGKKRLLNYTKIMGVLYGAVEKDGINEKAFLHALRTGLRRVKNRHFKNICVNKKALSEQNE
ncbi:PREDICTED: uncharacterized protein LOC108369408 [Rhagoletis zephyria]|uniref:uncharacterized protein LOC108369408 n=1 Tax=Rhagoletis zephyria TaxID=28612 RepID=UPI0008113E99|nr:PREDICTED: uncharacterized protein LOC108369408 [Rhagoletis zephyria]XP_036344201.1 uncharacterized protein LOC118753429 [Rhagoletis pomonella]